MEGGLNGMRKIEEWPGVGKERLRARECEK